ncbi:MAG TPA: BatA domain-containing protein [Ignavibacteria bacterium]|nr:BatA domain-containing protein [Ignavibacteria bacterium]
MSFLNATMLWGLAAISIPILIHIFNLRKVKKVEFSTLMFLKELQKSKLKRIKLKQILLLLTRIFIIIFLVMAFSKPVINNLQSSGSSAISNVFIVIDNSFSMSVRDESGSYLDQSKNIVDQIISKYKDVDNVYIIPTSDLLLKYKDFLVQDLNSVKPKTDSVNISYIKNNLSLILNYSNNIINNNTGIDNNDIYIISDFQTIDLDNIKESEIYSFKNSDLYLIKYENRIVNNITIEDFEIQNSILNSDSELKLKFKIANNSKYNALNKNVNLFVDGNKVSEKYIDLLPDSKNDVEMNFRVEKIGNVFGKIELVRDDLLMDEIKEDNSVYFNLFIPDKYEILINEFENSSSNYIDLLINSLKIQDLSGYSQNLTFNVNKASVNSENLENYNLIILSGLNSIDENTSIKLYDFVLNGGGLLVFPGNSPDFQNLNSSFFSRFNGLLLNRELNGYNEMKFTYFNTKHPIIENIFISDDVVFDNPVNIKSYYEILKNKNSVSLISLNNNSDFLVESKVGEGSIIVSSVPADLNKSDFPINRIFAPVIFRSILYLSNNFELNKYLQIGKNNLIKLRLKPGNLVLETPDNTSKNIFVSSDYINIDYNKFTQFPGNYLLTDSLGNKQYFSLNKNSVESNLLYANENELESYFEKYNFRNIEIMNAGNNIGNSITQLRSGFELWWIFLILSGVFILVEYFLSRNLEN